MRRVRLMALVALYLVYLLCAGPAPRPAAAQERRASAPLLQLVGPGAGEQTLVTLVSGARSRVLVEAFALTDAAVINALAGAERRGVDVRVMVDPAGVGSAATLGQLGAMGIRTHYPNPVAPIAATHMDAVVIDASAVAVATSGLTPGGIGPLGRGYVAISRDRLDVLQVASIFYDDWLGRAVNHFAHHMLVLPDANGASSIASYIDGARSRIELYTSGLSDPTILAALRDARARRVVARVLTQPSSNSPALRGIAQAGFMRFGDAGSGTILVVDRRLLVIGSMDLSSAALGANRELGVALDAPGPARFVSTTFLTQFAHGVVLRPVVPKPVQRRRTVTHGRLTATFDVSRQVRVGGEGVIAVTTVAHARVSITIAYPRGSKPGPGAGGDRGVADAQGAFIYRWILTGHVKPGTATVRIVVAGAGTSTTYPTSFQVLG